MIRPIVGLLALLCLVGGAILAVTGLSDSAPTQIYAAVGLLTSSVWLFVAESVLKILTEIRDRLSEK